MEEEEEEEEEEEVVEMPVITDTVPITAIITEFQLTLTKRSKLAQKKASKNRTSGSSASCTTNKASTTNKTK
jgi:hypothetical protein